MAINLSFIERIAEKRIKEAIKNGDFDDLEGKGEPLRLEDDSFVPQDLRIAYKMLKNSGFLPPELETQKEIRSTMDLLRSARDEEERYRQVRKLNVLVMKVNMLRPRPVNLEKDQIYYKKIVEKISVKDSK